MTKWNADPPPSATSFCLACLEGGLSPSATLGIFRWRDCVVMRVMGKVMGIGFIFY